MQTRQLDTTFAVVKPDQRVDCVDVQPELYAALDADYEQFKHHALVACHHFHDDWPSWERHPAGDEIVVLLSGTVTLVIRSATGDDSLTLFEQGDYAVVPQNAWHTAKITEPTTMLFITPGEGTEHADALPDAPHNP
ncbi:MAG: cupin domain-containing protein [Pseudomonadota bacterium]